jgi:DNA-binding NarL/FixJ family response regulator
LVFDVCGERFSVQLRSTAFTRPIYMAPHIGAHGGLLDGMRVIRILIVDDHPALRAGLWALLRAEPGLQPVGAVDAVAPAMRELEAQKCDVALVDYRLGSHNGLYLCRKLKSAGDSPRVIVYSAFTEGELSIPAMLAGADGVLSKSAPSEELVEAIRAVAAGRKLFPELRHELIGSSAAQLDPDDLPIVGMVLEGTSLAEIAYTLGVSPTAIEERIYKMIERLDVANADRELRV